MASTKRFYWLKLKEDFFTQKEIKKLRRIAGGDTFTIIYLKILLRSLKNNGRLYYDGIEDDFISELALDIDEDDDNVRMTVSYLMTNGILVQNNLEEYEVLTAQEMTGSECNSAERVRRFRAQNSQNSTSKALQSNTLPLLCNSNVTNGNTEKEIDKEKREKRKELNCAEARNTGKKAHANPDDDDFWKFAKDNAELAELFYKTTGIYPVKSQFGRWVNDLRDLSEAGISAEQLLKTINYMQSEGIPLSAPGSCLKTAQWLKSRGSVPTKQTKQKPAYNAFEQLAMQMNGIPEPSWDVEL